MPEIPSEKVSTDATDRQLFACVQTQGNLTFFFFPTFNAVI